MAKARRNKDGVVEPVKIEKSYAETLPTAAEQRPVEDDEPQTAAAQETEERGEEKRKPIGKEEIFEAKQKMQSYFSAKKAYDERYRANFEVYNLMYTKGNEEQYTKDSEGNLKKRLIQRHIGAQTLNVIMNKHADAMDNYPEPVFLPREKSDEETATMLSSIIPCVLERNRYQKTYDTTWTDKLVGGACATAVTWDSDAEYGLGDIRISRVDIMSMAWEPYIEDIQDSDAVFVVNYVDIERAKAAYPDKLAEVSAEDVGLTEHGTYDARSKTENKAAIIDWYYKKDGQLHFCKFCGDVVITASENEPERYPKGFYEHGRYPFVIGALFPLRDTPVGFSFIDVCRAPQRELDELKYDILKNVKVNSQTRSLVDRGAAVNFDDLSDLNVEYVEANFQNQGKIIVPLETKDIAGGALAMYNAITDEIKMTTGTNDASNGASAAGVTSGSAIAALQEAGGKISRDVNKGGFREFEEICELIYENIRQFYNPERWFRIVGEDKKTKYVQFGNEKLLPQEYTIEGDDTIYKRVPVFDIEVKAQRSNPFTTAANNQMMVDMFRMGAFAPENADAALGMLECMSFEGKDKLTEIIKQNSQLLKAVQQLQGRVDMANAMVAQQAAEQTAAEAPPTQLPIHSAEGAKI